MVRYTSYLCVVLRCGQVAREQVDGFVRSLLFFRGEQFVAHLPVCRASMRPSILRADGGRIRPSSGVDWVRFLPPPCCIKTLCRTG